MEVILLERVAKLGHMGEVVRSERGRRRSPPPELSYQLNLSNLDHLEGERIWKSSCWSASPSSATWAKSSDLSEAAADPRLLNCLINSTSQILITSKENEYGSHLAGARRQARPHGRSRPI